ncbi:MAG TPA: formyltetrahydrofolate deformylase [Candidatus Nitrosotenuis sp.]|jgi:formyltetrahydrofolate deformylase|nr:formyltetrahydrofolate deformylase [Candidatus Nitrosotenuis sp.]
MRQIKPTSHIFLFECPDQKGLTTAITGLFLKNDLNILSAFEYVDCQSQRFFLRLEAEGDMDRESLFNECHKLFPRDYWIHFPTNEPKKIIVLGSTQPYCFGDLALRCLYKEIFAEIAAFMSDHVDLEPLAQKFDKPFYYIPVESSDQSDHEAAIEQVIDNYQPDYVVLAKYNRLLSHEFVSRYPNKIINVNHSFLPTSAHLQSYKEAYQRGIKLIGATAHFVTDDINNGPIITQSALAIPHAANEEDLKRVGHNIEKACLAEALQIVCEDRIFVHNNRTVICE